VRDQHFERKTVNIIIIIIMDSSTSLNKIINNQVSSAKHFSFSNSIFLNPRYEPSGKEKKFI
jgi:hypothetical protein